MTTWLSKKQQGYWDLEQVGIDNYYLLHLEGTWIKTLLETLWLLSILWLPKVSGDKKGLLSLSSFIPYFVVNEVYLTALHLVDLLLDYALSSLKTQPHPGGNHKELNLSWKKLHTGKSKGINTALAAPKVTAALFLEDIVGKWWRSHRTPCFRHCLFVLWTVFHFTCHLHPCHLSPWCKSLMI